MGHVGGSRITIVTDPYVSYIEFKSHLGLSCVSVWWGWGEGKEVNKFSKQQNLQEVMNLIQGQVSPPLSWA